MILTNSPLQVVDFRQTETSRFKPAFEAVISQNKIKLREIAGNKDRPTFENTVKALEHLNYDLKRLEEIFFNLNAAETNKEMQQLAQEISPLLTAYYNDITLNKTLFERIKEVHDSRQTGITSEEKRLLDETYKSFVRNGANLNDKEKEEFRKVSEELPRLCLKFDENLLDETNAYQLYITNEGDLEGLPGFVRESAAQEAGSRNLKGWVFTLKAPSYMAFMKYSANRGLRETLYRAYNTRCFRNNEKDNQQIIKQIVNLRLKMAQILGYKSYAEYALEERMAKSAERVNGFLNELLIQALPVARKEYAELTDYAKAKSAEIPLQRWDWSYFSENLKNEKFSVTDELTKPYFRLENVEAGIFNLAEKLYGIVFEQDNTLPVYHPEVKVYRVNNHDGTYLALLYIDYFPREGKQGGAWMTNYLEQYRLNGKDYRPHVSLVLNCTRPTETAPSLLTYEEVRTFLHEFGHALHSIFSRCTYQSLSGTNVYRDFVELPSQIMENWAEQKEWLNHVAIHYKSGEKMPAEMLDNILKSRNFNSGYAFVRQLSFGLNDMAWHSLTSTFEGSVAEFENQAMDPTEIFPPVDKVCMSTGFHHIFGGGYAAGYYGYKWAEVLEADAFALFKEKGVFDRETAQKFREHILSRGGTEDPSVLYRQFRGQDPSIEALLKKSGLK